jgi:hypothetical protein
MKTPIVTIIALSVLMLMSPANAALIDSRDNTFFTDTASNLDWLDISKTFGKTYNDINGELSSNKFSGWRFATGGEFLALTSSTEADILISFFLNFIADETTSTGHIGGFVYSPGIDADYGLIRHIVDSNGHKDLIDLVVGGASKNGILTGSFLVRDSIRAVPIPAAFFIFAPALLGFMGLRHKVKKSIA